MRQQQTYDVGVYCRLSRDDKNSTAESMSISNQRQMLTDYVKERGWNLQECYVDEGVSSTTFERPDFQRMIRDVETGRINCIITKDLSRLGRNYVQVGQYTDFVFPQYGVRYIAVYDDYDSVKGENDIVPFKNIINEFYPKEVSKKVRQVKKASAVQGKFMGSKAPYGYVKSPTNKHHLIIDPEAANIVRRLFMEFSNGDSGRGIAAKLNIEGIENPRTYHYRQIGKPNPHPEESNAWGSNTVLQLLKNQVYIGHMVQGKREVVSFKTKRRQFVPCDEWIVVENTHEPIIDLDTWERVQKRIEDSKTSKSHNPIRTNNTNEVSLFSGLIRCADCGSLMHFTQRKHRGKIRLNYRCGRYTNYGKEQCSPHTIALDMLKEVVLSDIRQYATLAENDEEILIQKVMASSTQDRNSEQNLHQSKIRELKKRATTVEQAIKQLFEEKLAGNVPDSIFKKLMGDYDAEQIKLADEISGLERKLENAVADKSDVGKWINLIKKCIHLDELDRATAVALINCIEVSEPFDADGQRQQNITIKYNFIGTIPETPVKLSIGA
ncbi:MAG: recombinase family protein [Oscillospiraceae bacterium]|nr:recombinase family protein [Oscillospiraceae bacterium]